MTKSKLHHLVATKENCDDFIQTMTRILYSFRLDEYEDINAVMFSFKCNDETWKDICTRLGCDLGIDANHLQLVGGGDNL